MDKEIFYQGDLNTKRIAAYNKLANDYNVSVSTVREIFSAGIGFACESTPAEDWVLTMMIDNIPQNRPLYKDSGLWQVRSDDMEDVLFQQGVCESFFDFIKRVFDVDNDFKHI